MPINIDRAKLNQPKSDVLKRISSFKAEQAKKTEQDINDFLKKAVVFVAQNYPNNTILASREAAMFWVKVLKLALIRGDLLFTFGADGQINALMMCRPVAIESFKPLDPFEFDDSGTVLMVDVGIIKSGFARSRILEALNELRPQCTHIAWVRQGDASTLAVVERNKFKLLGLISNKQRNN